MENGLKKLLILIGIIVFAATIFTAVRIHKTNQKYKEQIKKIETALQSWSKEYTNLLPEQEGEMITVPLRTLKQSGYIDENFKNPKTRRRFSNQLLMTIEKKKTNYQFKILDKDKNLIEDYDDINKSAPMVVLKGKNLEYAELNRSYKDKGYKAITADGKEADEVEIEIKKEEKVVSKIDTSKQTTYKLTYRISFAKEDSVITRMIEVKDTEKPKIKMEKLILKIDEVKNFDLMKGVTLEDNSNGKLEVKIKGELASFEGRYVLTYYVTDESSNKSEKKRIVRVEK